MEAAAATAAVIIVLLLLDKKQLLTSVQLCYCVCFLTKRYCVLGGGVLCLMKRYSTHSFFCLRISLVYFRETHRCALLNYVSKNSCKLPLPFHSLTLSLTATSKGNFDFETYNLVIASDIFSYKADELNSVTCSLRLFLLMLLLCLTDDGDDDDDDCRRVCVCFFSPKIRFIVV